MGEPKKVSETVPIECSSASVVAVVEKWLHPDTAKDIDALDCKSNAQDFERLLRYFIEAWARSHELKPEQFCELVPEEVMRAAVRMAVDRYSPGSYRITTYASWWVRQGVTRYLATHGRQLPSKRRRTEREPPAMC
jgi:hypothetical protein